MLLDARVLCSMIATQCMFYSGGNKPKEAAQNAAEAAKSALPAEPQQAAKDAVSAAKDNLPEPPKDLQNPIQNLFSGTPFHCAMGTLVATETPRADLTS